MGNGIFFVIIEGDYVVFKGGYYFGGEKGKGSVIS